MNFYDSLPAINAILNGSAAVLLIVGFLLIRNRKIQAHRNVMLTAFVVSVAFLVCYLLNHYHAGVVYYHGPSPTLYYWVLGTHTPLAAAVPVLAIITLTRGLKGRIRSHRAIAKWTLPIWLYVSITGVIVYEMLY